MNKRPLVSVLIPVYNAETYLSECIKSVLNQTYEKIEIIIIDDGSTDKSLTIAKEHEERYLNIKAVSQQNKGASAARNKAFSLSEGEYIQYLDADDFLHEDKIMAQMQRLLKEETSTLSFGKCKCFYKEKQNILKRDLVIYRKDHFKPCDFLYTMWLNSEAIPPHGYLMHRSLVEASGGWNESLSNNDDGEFFARVILASQNIIFVPESIAYYRMDTAGSLSKDVSEKSLVSKVKSVSLYAEHIKKCHKNFDAALRVVYTVALIKIYPLNEGLAKKMDSEKRENNILGYQYPKRQYIYNLLFFIIGIKGTAWVHKMMLNLRRIGKIYK